LPGVKKAKERRGVATSSLFASDGTRREKRERQRDMEGRSIKRDLANVEGKWSVVEKEIRSTRYKSKKIGGRNRCKLRKSYRGHLSDEGKGKLKRSLNCEENVSIYRRGLGIHREEGS